MQPLLEVPPTNIVPLPMYRTQKVVQKKDPLILNMIVEIDIPLNKVWKMLFADIDSDKYRFGIFSDKVV